MNKYIFLPLIFVFIISCKKEEIIKIRDTGTLPKLEVEIDDYYLWSADSGIYVIGENGTIRCEPIANWNQNWEHPAQIKYIENNSILFEEKVGLRIKANCSRALEMKSFGFYWRNEYGNNKLQYPIFKESNLSIYKQLFLRNAGSGDFGRTHIKDISSVAIIRGYGNVEFQEYLQCVVYLNNEYWGIYNLRESITPSYFEYHFGFPKENIDLLEGSELNPFADDGYVFGYLNNVINFIQNNDLSNNNNYNHISNIIDVDSYIDYIIFNTYVANQDWPMHNKKWWKDRHNPNSKWRWVLFDTDMSFRLNDVDKVWIGDLIGQPDGTNQSNEGFFIFNNLIKNLEFKKKFFNRYMYFIENVFEKNRVESIIRMNKNNISLEYDNFYTKWPSVNNKSKWDKAINDMIEFNNQRNDIMKKIIQNLSDE